MSVAFSLPRKPKSVNASLPRGYIEAIARAAREKHTGEFLQAPLYSRILWFHKRPTEQGDIDNIAKRIHDALKEILFADDRLITHSLAVRVDASAEVDLLADPDNPEAFAELTGMLADPAAQNVLYIEVGVQLQRKLQLGPIAP